VETLDASSPVPADETGQTAVVALFQARYLDMVRLAVLLGADDIAQEAFAQLLTRHVTLRDPGAALAYVRSTVCNLTRKRWRYSVVVRSRTLAMPDEASPEHTAILREDHREVLAALASLPARKREAIVLRYWLDLSEGEIAAAMGVSAGTVKSQLSKGMGSLAKALEALA
jgi:RNA polymerase sigma factor (sigma-70 family)